MVMENYFVKYVGTLAGGRADTVVNHTLVIQSTVFEIDRILK